MPLKRWWVATGWVFIVAVVLVAMLFGWIYLDFSARSEHQNDEDPIPAIGVVFTGETDRILFALRLMEQGRIKKLLIVGKDLDTRQLLDDFVLSSEQIGAIDRNAIVVGSESSTTLENGLETWCMLRDDLTHKRKALTLVTAGYHMARSSLILERSLPSGYKIVRVASDAHKSEDTPSSLWSSEWRKFVPTWFITLLVPQSKWVTGSMRPCAGR